MKLVLKNSEKYPLPSIIPSRPGFHEENVDDAIAQLRTVLPLLVGRVTSIGLAALGKDGDGGDDDGDGDGVGVGGDDLDAWLNAALATAATSAVQAQAQAQRSGLDSSSGVDEDGQRSSSGNYCLTLAPSTITTPGETTTPGGAAVEVMPLPALTDLLPSVRCGIEMALVHLVARAAGVSIAVAMSSASGLPCRGSIEINGLAARGERLAEAEQAVRGMVCCG